MNNSGRNGNSSFSNTNRFAALGNYSTNHNSESNSNRNQSQNQSSSSWFSNTQQQSSRGGRGGNRGGNRGGRGRGGRGGNSYNHNDSTQRYSKNRDEDNHVHNYPLYSYPNFRPKYADEDGVMPPQLPKITYTAQHMLNYSLTLIGSKVNDYQNVYNLQFNEMLMRNAIMNQWKNYNQPLNMDLLNNMAHCELKGKEVIFNLPDFLNVRLELPVEYCCFNNYKWGMMSRAKFPGLRSIKFTASALKAYGLVFKEFMASNKTACRSVILQSVVSEEKTKLDKAYRDKTDPEYIEKLSKLLYDHSEEIRDKMKEVRKYYDAMYEHIQEIATSDEAVDPVLHPELRNLWEHVTCNPIVCGIDEYVQPIINNKNKTALFVEYVKDTKPETFISLINALRANYFGEFPDYNNDDMYDFDETCQEIVDEYNRQRDIILAGLEKQEDERLAAAIKEREEEDAKWRAEHPNWEEEEEDWNENYEAGNTNSWYVPSDDEAPKKDDEQQESTYDDPCVRKFVCVPYEVEEQLKESAKMKYIEIHKAEIEQRHAINEDKFNKWKITNKYCEVLLGLLHLKIHLKDLEASKKPLDDSKVGYDTDKFNMAYKFDSYEEMMEKSRIALVFEYYTLYDNVLTATSKPFEAFPKKSGFNNPVRTLYNSLNLESIEGKSRMILSFNALDPLNVEIIGTTLMSMFNVDNALEAFIGCSIAVAGSPSLAYGSVLLYKMITQNYVRITELVLSDKLNGKEALRNRNFWNLFWGLYFTGVLVIEEGSISNVLSTLLNQSKGNDNKASCFKSFELTYTYYKKEKIDFSIRLNMVKRVIYDLGLPYLHVFKMDAKIAVVDALELEFKDELAAYRKMNKL